MDWTWASLVTALSSTQIQFHPLTEDGLRQRQTSSALESFSDQAGRGFDSTTMYMIASFIPSGIFANAISIHGFFNFVQTNI
jgi:hypothetical protein